MIFPGGMNKITSHQLHEKFSDLKFVRRELPIVYSLQLAAWGQFQNVHVPRSKPCVRKQGFFNVS